MPKFSVVIPNYNRAQKVKVAIQSVLDQTYTDFEIIIVDDKSTDNSISEIEQLKSEKIFVHQLKRNSGAAVARNYGVNLAKGEFISFLDSDDFYEKNFLEESNKLLSETSTDVGFMWTGVRYHYKDRTYERAWTPPRKKNPYITFLHNLQIGSGSGITLKRSAFLECGGFNENLPAVEDTDFFLRISQQYDYVNSDKILMNVIKKGDDRMSKSFEKIAVAYNIFLPEHFDIIDGSKILQAKFYYKLMWLNFHIYEKERARHYYNKIPSELKSIKIKIVKYLYEILPLKQASYIHQKLSA
ncbi:glycosyltransferase family 2 protein [Christiangramia sabulilitoris]|uniref:Glycosyltransferase family 2 protein n=1 Tax=Christiangramia sabulilitoris TaxID=2583991 RepID=A0A550I2C7_9FLAO|nr:glycosyltransferase family 2 protein [Christiangramia sabulilitoris]TRO65110.1 glycosyltransferase family 2 protein [Christiangramia sabulilitoris]